MYMDQHLHYVKGPLNVITDTFSRLLRTNDYVSSASVGKKAATNVSNSKHDTKYFSLINDKEILETFLALPLSFVEQCENT